MEGESERIGESKILTVDEVKKLLRLSGEKAKELENSILEKQDGLFKDIMIVTFGWRLQEDGTRKLVSRLPNGKFLFPDRSENIQDIEPGIPYVCLVYEREREGFAKIISEEYQPKIYVPTHRVPVMVWRDENGRIHRKAPLGKSYEMRIIAAIKEMEDMGFQSVRVIFRKNQAR